MTERQELRHLGGDVRASWQRFLDAFEPLRPELYRYCRHLTGTPWDAEDLAQDTLARAFVTLGTLFSELPEPRGWLFRVASNAWIDRARRERIAAGLASEPALVTPVASDRQSTREAAGTLITMLSPQERVALVLKDVFEFSLEEIAIVLGTTVGAVKAALSRGRVRLLETAPERAERVPAKGVLEEFTSAFNAGDLERLTALLLDSASVEIVGLVTEYGQEAPKDPTTGSFAGTLTPISLDERGGVPSELLEGYLGRAPRCEVRSFRGRWLLLFWYDHVTGPFVRTLMQVETEGDRISRVQNYFFSPQVIAEVCAELGVPHRDNGYRYWHAAS